MFVEGKAVPPGPSIGALQSTQPLVKGIVQGITKRCCLYWLTNSAFVYEPTCGEGRGGGGGCRVSANEYSCTQ